MASSIFIDTSDTGGGGTLVGPLVLADGSALAPAYSFATETNSGLYRVGTNDLGLAINGSAVLDANATRLNMTSGYGVQFNAGAELIDDGANIISQRNGTNAQKLEIWNTWAATPNGDFLRLDWQRSANVMEIMTDKVGSGTVRNLVLGTFGNASVTLATAGSNRWQVTLAGALITPTDNALDIGASGATRPRNLYLGSSIKQVGGITTSGVVGTPAIVATGRAVAQSAANASVSTFIVGASDASFAVSMNMNVSAATGIATTLTCTYTDESGTGRTMIFPVAQLAGSFIVAGAITGTGAWESPVLHIRAQAASTITLLVATGTFTGVTYTVEGIIQQLA